MAVATVLLLAGCAAAEAASPAEPATISEASGITFRDGSLYVVDDSARNAYFRVPLPAGAGPLLDLNAMGPVRVEIPLGILTDLEAIEFLADGRLVVLSERLRALVDRDGPLVEYDYPLAEIGRRGLEGLGVRRLPDGSSRVAVLWEGGYPDYGSLHPQVQAALGHLPLKPLVFVHDIAPGARPGRVRWSDAVLHVMLDVPRPPGEEPDAQRFRAPGIAWVRLPERGPDVWGFLTILASQNAVPKPEYRNHWLERFDLDGEPVGEPLRLEDMLPPELAGANWEGLGWIERGKRVVLVHEGDRQTPPHAFLLDLPGSWQYEEEED